MKSDKFCLTSYFHKILNPVIFFINKYRLAYLQSHLEILFLTLQYLKYSKCLHEVTQVTTMTATTTTTNVKRTDSVAVDAIGGYKDLC